MYTHIDNASPEQQRVQMELQTPGADPRKISIDSMLNVAAPV